MKAISCRNCDRTDLTKADMRKDASVYRGICKSCWSKDQACTNLLKKVALTPHRYNSCNDCDKFFSKMYLKCPACKSFNFVPVKGMK